MRVSTAEVFGTSLTQMKDLQDSLTDLQVQIASGIRIQKPSDDPVGSSQALKIQEEISINNQFKKNISFAESRNEIMDNVLDGTVNVLQRLRDIAVLSSNDTYNQQDRQGFAVEIRSLQKEMQGLLNSRDGSGEYLFSGYQGPVAPFQERPSGGYDYFGDDGQRSVQISPSSYVPVSDSGKSLFVDIQSEGPTIVTRASEANSENGSGSISVGQVVNQSSYELAYPEDYIITFGDPLENQNRRTYTVTRAGDGDFVQGTDPAGYLVDVTYQPGDPIQFNGIEVAVQGNPAAGDAFFVESSSSQNLLNIIERFAVALESTSGNGQSIEVSPEVIGMASPARPTLSNAGNYVAAQTITVIGEDGTEQSLEILANESIDNVSAALNALAGVTATPSETTATLDLRSMGGHEGDLIQFTLNGADISAAVGSNDTATYANLDTALTAAIGGTLSFVNNGDGTFTFTESSSADIGIENFEVVDFPAVSMDLLSGFNAGDQIQFTLTGSNAETVNIDYVVAAGDNDEFLTQVQADIAAAGLSAVFSATQSGAGNPIQLQYLGDTNGNANVLISGFTDNGAEDAVITLTNNSGTTLTNNISGANVTRLQNTVDINVAAVEGRSTAGFSGAIGDPITLRDQANDSSSIAGRLIVTTDPEYQISSTVESENGGLIRSQDLTESLVDQLQTTLGNTISNFDHAQDSILQARSRVGSRLVLLETSLDLNEGVNKELSSFLSDIRDLDYSQALTELNLQTFILQAAQNSFVRITQLSLFNFL